MQVADVRGVLLDVIKKNLGWSYKVVIEKTVDELNGRKNSSLQREVLDEWQSLINDGIVAWGTDMLNVDPPGFHLTNRGVKTLENLSRDPANSAGYLGYLKASSIDPIAESYIQEALQTYNRACYKAAAVMVGAASERLILELRDVTQVQLASLGRLVSKKLTDWRIKTVFDELTDVLTDALDRSLKITPDEELRKLRDSLGYHWPSLFHGIRASRNDAGHPVSIAPVTAQDVHAALLTFPHLVRIINQVKSWIPSAPL